MVICEKKLFFTFTFKLFLLPEFYNSPYNHFENKTILNGTLIIIAKNIDKLNQDHFLQGFRSKWIIVFLCEA